jgi:hypothetical protein
VKSKRISLERAHAIVTEDTATEDWHEQLLVTFLRVKAFVGKLKDKQCKLINFAAPPIRCVCRRDV